MKYFVFGDTIASKHNVESIVSKYGDHDRINISLESNLDEISASVFSGGLFNSSKLFVIKDFALRKEEKEYVLYLFDNIDSNNVIVVCDNANAIKETKGKLNKTAETFLKEMGKHGVRVINNGFDIKDNSNGVDYVINQFDLKGKKCDQKSALCLIKRTSGKRSSLISEINKLSLLADEITPLLINEVVSKVQEKKELYEFSNVLDEGDYFKSLISMDNFISNGVHPFVLSEIMVKKTRWKLVAHYMILTHGPNASNMLLNFGKFPHEIYQSNEKNKKEKSDVIKENLKDYVFEEWGEKNFRENAELKKEDYLPMPFLASKIIDSVHKCHNFARKKYAEEYVGKARTMLFNAHTSNLECLREIRKGINEKDNLCLMVENSIRFKC